MEDEVKVQERLDTLRKIAAACGYGLTEHGSMKRDIDLVAVPWVAEAVEPARLLGAIMAATGAFITTMECKPHGRIGVILQGYGHKLWDLSVFPPTTT